MKRFIINNKLKVIYIYKNTYPNNKIYIGRDSTGDMMRYFGSVDRDYLEKDFPWDKVNDMIEIVIKKEIIWHKTISEIKEADIKELNEKEKYFIEYYESNDPEKGYNQRPKKYL